jgi:A/G-specific adenine glycosylase
MKKREAKDIWQGLYDFYLIEQSKEINPIQFLSKDGFLKSLAFDKKNITVTNAFKHVLSHQQIICRFVCVNIADKTCEINHTLKPYSRKKVAELPKPVLIDRYLQNFHFS